MTRHVPVVTAPVCELVARRLARSDGVLVGLDFDGTLAPIADDPDVPTITRECRAALQPFVAASNASVAVISGRELSDLRARVDLEGVVYAGCHGLTVHREGNTLAHPRVEQCRPAVRRSVRLLEDRLADIPGWTIEDKGITAAVHVRHTPRGLVEEVRAAIETTVREQGASLRVTPGKEVFEIRPAVGWDKGAALEQLSQTVPDGWITVYLGDDTTDEDAFRAIQPAGLAVLVGSRKETTADYRLPGQKSVAPFLRRLADAVPSSGVPSR